MSEADNPGFDCITGRHLFFEVYDEDRVHVGGWCPWCGTGSYDGDRITDDGRAVGFTPAFETRIPDGFHRELSDR
jgi:hypothetical protein